MKEEIEGRGGGYFIRKFERRRPGGFSLDFDFVFVEVVVVFILPSTVVNGAGGAF